MGSTRNFSQGAERRGADTVNCHTEPLPKINFGLLAAAVKAKANDPEDPIHPFNGFIHNIYAERTNGATPKPEDNIAPRANDDLAIGAMYGIEYPDIYPKVEDIIRQLGIVATESETPQ